MPYKDMIAQCPGAAGYWPLDDAAGSVSAEEVISNRALSVSGSFSFQAASLIKAVAGDPNPTAGQTSGGSLASGAGALPSPSGSKTLELWFYGTIAPSNAVLVGKGNFQLGQNNAGALLVPGGAGTVTSTPFIVMGVAADKLGLSSMRLGFSTTSTPSLITGPTPSSNSIHHLVATVLPGSVSNSTLWLDGVAAYTWSAPADDSSLSAAAWVIAQGLSTGVFQHVVIYGSLLSIPRIQQHYRVGNNWEQRLYNQAERLFTPNVACPTQGSFNIKEGHIMYYSDVQAQGGIVTSDPTYLDVLRRSGYYTESAA